jgi:nitrate reductase (NAD(P)H)
VYVGNRRKELNMIKHTRGFNFGAGAISTSIWKGVKLCDLLNMVGVQKGAQYVCFEGADQLVHGHYGTSLFLCRAMDPTNDVLVAYEMNGERLAPDHGFPVRIVVPGNAGGRSIKWLAR